MKNLFDVSIVRDALQLSQFSLTGPSYTVNSKPTDGFDTRQQIVILFYSLMQHKEADRLFPGRIFSVWFLW